MLYDVRPSAVAQRRMWTSGRDGESQPAWMSYSFTDISMTTAPMRLMHCSPMYLAFADQLGMSATGCSDELWGEAGQPDLLEVPTCSLPSAVFAGCSNCGVRSL